MKTINNTVVEVLPALLKFFETNGKEGKNRTIRRAWKESECCNAILISKPPSGSCFCSKCHKHTSDIGIERPPEHKVGDKVPLVWKRKSKYDEFCCECGGAVFRKGGDDDHWCECGACNSQRGHFFNKHLGTVEITEVFKVQMWKNNPKHRQESFDGYNCELLGTIEDWAEALRNEWIIDLAKRDGFKSAEQMFQVLDKKYDLSMPKTFYVNGWKNVI